MHKIVFMTLITLPLFAGFFPTSTQTSISSIKKNTISLASPLPVNGMSGVVVHNYGNSLEAITNRIIQTSSNGDSKTVDVEIIHHNKLPTIKTPITKGDKVIGGYLYNNILLLAPDANTYAKITSLDNKKWVHPDLFALFLAKEGDISPTKNNLASFAKEYQVGLIYIVRRNSAILLDPISGQVVGKKTLSNLPLDGQYPFFMHFDSIQTGWFSGSEKGNYYQMMESI